MVKVRTAGLAFVLGALVVLLSSFLEKWIRGVPIGNPEGYLVPALVGGLSGLAAAIVLFRNSGKSPSPEGSHLHLHDVLDQTNDMIQSVSAEGHLLHVNQAWRTALGYDDAEIPNLNLQDIIEPAHWDRSRTFLERVTRQEPASKLELDLVAKDGHRVPVLAAIFHDPSLDGPAATRWICQDLSRRKAGAANDRLMASVFENTAEGIIITDADSRIMMVNQAFTEVTGYELDEVLGERPSILKSGRHKLPFYESMWAAITDHGHWQGEIWNRRKSGAIYPEWLTISTVRDDRGQITNYVGVFTDITVLKRAEERLRYMATHDPLTDLPNRILFLDRLEHAIRRARRSNHAFAILFLDLDNFKQVNDKYGHLEGDILLQAVGERLSKATRKSDTIARLGGDEFTILLEQIPDAQVARVVAQKIIAAMEEPFEINGDPVHVSASIGYSLYPDNGTTVNELLRSADEAMYIAKKSGAGFLSSTTAPDN